jgi:hypothetical protein
LYFCVLILVFAGDPATGAIPAVDASADSTHYFVIEMVAKLL